jgi:radical SAM protein with 4Fe4S-binding SPASM domain
MIIYKDEIFGFFEIFNETNGTLIRSDVGGVDPVMRSFPELLDVGIMGYCESGEYCRNAGIDCYQRGGIINTSHMTVEDFEKIVKQATGKTFQIALGGAGDPNKHPQFEEILRKCKEFRIVPNMTTSGFRMTDVEAKIIKQYCGAVAVSWYSRWHNGCEKNPETLRAIESLVYHGCITNIHYVISNDTIDEAIMRLEHNLFPDGVNAVIFILYKPVGNGVIEKVLKKTDIRLDIFFSLITEKKLPYKIGFDTCFTPAILRFANTVPSACVDACEAANFSMYIDSQMNCYPCSFGIWNTNMSESLKNKSLREIWMGEKFMYFRKQNKKTCNNCKHRTLCQSGCRLGLDIDLCFI